MTVAVREFACVLADTSVFCNVAEALEGRGLITILDYLDTRISIVREVHREMNGLTISRFPDLATLKTVEMVNEYLRAPALILDPDLAADVPNIVEHSGLFTPDPERPRKNYGEVATVLAAARRQVPVLMDDADGRKLARRRNVPCMDTRELVLQMHLADALSADDAYAVWQTAALRKSGRAAFDQAVADRLGSA